MGDRLFGDNHFVGAFLERLEARGGVPRRRDDVNFRAHAVGDLGSPKGGLLVGHGQGQNAGRFDPGIPKDRLFRDVPVDHPDPQGPLRFAGVRIGLDDDERDIHALKVFSNEPPADAESRDDDVVPVLRHDAYYNGFRPMPGTNQSRRAAAARSGGIGRAPPNGGGPKRGPETASAQAGANLLSNPKTHMAETSKPASDGVINLFKPPGRSSAHYVYRLRPILGLRKIGHAGALDPFADGVLLACAGRATKLVERLMGLPKEYETALRLGVTNATFDTEKPFAPVPGAVAPTREAIDAALAGMIGEVAQAPPAHSAVKIGGVPSYRLARRGLATRGDDESDPPRTTRRVTIFAIDVLEYAWPRLRLRIECGRGTYIRAIARDLGAALGCGACCETLRRTRVGPFTSASAVNLYEADPHAVRAALLGIDQVEKLLGR